MLFIKVTDSDLWIFHGVFGTILKQDFASEHHGNWLR